MASTAQSSSGAGGANGNNGNNGNSGDRDAERRRQQEYDSLRRREEGKEFQVILKLFCIQKFCLDRFFKTFYSSWRHSFYEVVFVPKILALLHLEDHNLE